MLPAFPTGIARTSGGPAEVVADLECGRLLALEPVRVDRVDEGDRVVRPLGQLADDPQGRVEVAVDGHDPRARDEGLEELADRDPAPGRTTTTSSPAAAP